jgi:hypothetical protein
MATTARDVTAAMRVLHPAPVRLSVRASETPGWFRLRVPSACAVGLGGGGWLEGYLSRALGASVSLNGHRSIARRDCGRDVEYIVRIA